LTWEQIFYQVTKFFKYVSVIPFGIIFLLTTNPSEFASSLNRIGVNYKAAFAVALTLRYFPDVQRDYHDISQSQQARGLELSNKAKLADRFKNSLLIVIPLIFSSLDRVELISNAMDLRGFAKSKTRTWYTFRKFTRTDYTAVAISTMILILTVCVSIFVNHSRFYNPFM
jgi:energy-coupling factor transport system permease protein